MEEPNLNENDITKESFVEIASEKIRRILLFPGNDLFRTWAVKFLQKAARGFGHCEHEPWLNSLSAAESNEVILSNCRSSIRKLDLATPSLNSSLSFIISYPLQFNPFISALAGLFVNQIEESQQMCCVSHEELTEQCSTKNKVPANYSTSTHNYNDNVYEDQTKKKRAGSISSNEPSKKRKTDCVTQPLKTDEMICFLKQVWSWARTGYIKLDADILGDVLFHVPDSIEEVVLSWAREVVVSRQRANPNDQAAVNLTTMTAGFRRDTVPSDDDILHSLSVLQESPVFLAAAGSSPKLFQRCSSILNQLLIQAPGCSYSWSSLLSLCTTFAQETANGRAKFYPLQVQPLVLLLEVDPNILSSNKQREMISSQITSMCLSVPTRVTIAVLSHFPAWLPFLDHAILL